jgi:hypothetical protein
VHPGVVFANVRLMLFPTIAPVSVGTAGWTIPTVNEGDDCPRIPLERHCTVKFREVVVPAVKVVPVGNGITAVPNESTDVYAADVVQTKK